MIDFIRAGSLTTDSPGPNGLCAAAAAKSRVSVTVQPWNTRSPDSSSTKTAGQLSLSVPGSIPMKVSCMCHASCNSCASLRSMSDFPPIPDGVKVHLLLGCHWFRCGRPRRLASAERRPGRVWFRAGHSMSHAGVSAGGLRVFLVRRVPGSTEAGGARLWCTPSFVRPAGPDACSDVILANSFACDHLASMWLPGAPGAGDVPGRSSTAALRNGARR
jgi:hypothetical protein